MGLIRNVKLKIMRCVRGYATVDELRSCGLARSIKVTLSFFR